LFVVKNYTRWLFGEIDMLEAVKVDLDKKTVKVFKKSSQNKTRYFYNSRS